MNGATVKHQFDAPMAQLDRATVCGTVGRRFESSWAHHFFFGEVAERSKAVDSKSAVPYGYRGFESHPLLSSPEGEFVDDYHLSIVRKHNWKVRSYQRRCAASVTLAPPQRGVC